MSRTFDTADSVRDICSADEDLAPGLVCMLCGNCWNRVCGLKCLADVDCPSCTAIYCDVGWNVEA